MQILNATVDVIEALGGTSEVAKITGCTYPAVHNWRGFKSFPSRTYVVLIGALAARGYTAPPSLFGMVLPEVERAA